MAPDHPILWQLRISHFNEKVRWALDYKQIEHERRSVIPGYHQLKARRLTGGRTLPVLELDARRIGESSEIIKALEELKPEPALYPSDDSERAAALEIQDLFDELGHQLRRVLFDELLEDPALSVEIFYTGQPALVQYAARAVFPAARSRLRREYRVDPESAAEGRERVTAALDRIEAELEPSGFLVGDSFSVADLTAAAILFPLVLPEQYPYPLPDAGRWPAGAREFRDSVRDRPAFRWVQETYSRHRAPSAELVAA